MFVESDKRVHEIKKKFSKTTVDRFLLVKKSKSKTTNNQKKCVCINLNRLRGSNRKIDILVLFETKKGIKKPCNSHTHLSATNLQPDV